MKIVPHRSTSNFVSALEGLRAVAALGVMVTHVAFQTGSGPAVLERLDYLVAVFFALSAFVLWRHRQRYAQEGWGRYYAKRATRLLPAYWACVLVVLGLLPGAGFSWPQVVGNLTVTQIYLPGALAQGLTQLWSLCVEFMFYALLPVLHRLPRKSVLLPLAVASLGWGWIAQWLTPVMGGINAQIWPPAYATWFAVGIVAAELEGRFRPPRLTWLYWVLAAACLGAGSYFGPRGLIHPTPAEFAVRISIGAVFATCLVWPYALGAGSRVLESRPLRLLGRWSYSFFLWHVAVLWVVFRVTGIPLFSGHFFLILLLTLAASVPVAAASYYWIEEPLQQLLSRRRQTAA